MDSPFLTPTLSLKDAVAAFHQSRTSTRFSYTTPADTQRKHTRDTCRDTEAGRRKGAGGWRHYLHDGLSKILGAPIAQAGLEGGTDVVPVTAGLVAILARLDRRKK